MALPGLAPVAMQQGRYAGRLMARRLIGERPSPARRSATATRARWRRSAGPAPWREVRGLRFSGFIAWVAWLVVHIFYLIGFENRVVVLFAGATAT